MRKVNYKGRCTKRKLSKCNDRPLLGEGVQEYAPCIGVGMLDATVCDIYLVNKEGLVVGRPILVAGVDANTSLPGLLPVMGRWGLFLAATDAQFCVG